MSFRIAIPSYKRTTIIQEKTLRFLKNEGIPSDQIDIFVASEIERKIYESALGLEYSLKTGIVGINRQREFMESYYPNGTRVLFVDDDVCAIKTLYPGVPFDVLIERMFDIADQQGCKLWGVYPTDSGLCLQDRAVKGMTYIIGALYGMTISEFKPNYPHATTEDFTRSIVFHVNSGVIRFEGIGIRTKYFNPVGGLAEYRTVDRQEMEMNTLVNRWPQYLRLRRRDKKFVDVQFLRSKQQIISSPFDF